MVNSGISVAGTIGDELRPQVRASGEPRRIKELRLSIVLRLWPAMLCEVEISGRRNLGERQWRKTEKRKGKHGFGNLYASTLQIQPPWTFQQEQPSSPASSFSCDKHCRLAIHTVGIFGGRQFCSGSVPAAGCRTDACDEKTREQLENN